MNFRVGTMLVLLPEQKDKTIILQKSKNRMLLKSARGKCFSVTFGSIVLLRHTVGHTLLSVIFSREVYAGK